MWHVASVMHNRVNKKRPSLDHVVNEPFQFSARARKDLDAFVGKQTPEVHAAAERAMARAATERATDATHYMTSKLYGSAKRPSWAGKMDVAGVIGNHTFLRERKAKRK